ncbi:MAG: SRPBCC domain-containing protein [Flavobacteriales bacterium]
MSLTLHTEITINATQEEIWTQLTDFNSYPSWNPFITSISGTLAKGNKLETNIAGMNFKPTVLESIPNKKIVWLGKLLLKGLFDGEHCFEIIPQEQGCLFVQAEKFSGILVPLFRKKLEIETKEGFQKMNKMLKQRVEAIN